MSHNCQNLLIHCMDFRLVKSHSNWAQGTLGDKNYDLVAIAGSQKNFLDEATRATALKQVDISTRLHGVTQVNLVAHEDCGAYGGSKTFSSFEEEKAKYLIDMNEAEKIILAQFPTLTVKKYLMMLSGDVVEL